MPLLPPQVPQNRMVKPNIWGRNLKIYAPCVPPRTAKMPTNRMVEPFTAVLKNAPIAPLLPARVRLCRRKKSRAFGKSN